MSHTRLNLAKSSVLNLIQSLDETHSITLITFDSEAHSFPPTISNNPYNDTLERKDIYNNQNTSFGNHTDRLSSARGDEFNLPCNNYTYIAINEYFENLTATDGSLANITRAIESAIELNERIWRSRNIPENALSMIILLTDGMSACGNKSEIVNKDIRMLNKEAKIPIFSIGVGFDANMEFLEDVAGLFQNKCFIYYLNNNN